MGLFEVGLPQSPYVTSNCNVGRQWTCSVRIKPTNEFGVNDLKDIGLRFAGAEFGQHGLCFKVVFVSVIVKIDSYGIVAIKSRRDCIEQLSIFLSKLLTPL